MTFSNAKGRLVLACTGSAAGTCTSPQTAVAFSYDPVGRTQDFWQCTTTADCASVRDAHYNYDSGGDVTSWVHPEGFTLYTPVNAAQQVKSVSSSLTGTGQPQYLAQSISYTPWGAISQLENRCAGSGCVNTQETYTYNNRLQPWMIELGTTSNASCRITAWCTITFRSAGRPLRAVPARAPVPTSGTANNGNVMGYWYQDSANSSLCHTATYGYPGVNRLGTAAATGNSTYNLTFWPPPYPTPTATWPARPTDQTTVPVPIGLSHQ